MSMIKKYIKKDIYLQKKTQEIIDEMRLKQYNNGISKNQKQKQKKTETVTNENDKKIPKKIPKEKYMSPKERQKIIDNLRSIIIV